MPISTPSNQTSSKSDIVADNVGNVRVGFPTNLPGIGLEKFDGKNWTMFDISNTPLTAGIITALGIQNGSTIWAAIKLTNSTGELLSYNDIAWTNHTNLISSNYTYEIVADKSGDVWSEQMRNFTTTTDYFGRIIPFQIPDQLTMRKFIRQ